MPQFGNADGNHRGFHIGHTEQLFSLATLSRIVSQPVLKFPVSVFQFRLQLGQMGPDTRLNIGGREIGCAEVWLGFKSLPS